MKLCPECSTYAIRVGECLCQGCLLLRNAVLWGFRIPAGAVDFNQQRRSDPVSKIEGNVIHLRAVQRPQ